MHNKEIKDFLDTKQPKTSSSKTTHKKWSLLKNTDAQVHNRAESLHMKNLKTPGAPQRGPHIENLHRLQQHVKNNELQAFLSCQMVEDEDNEAAEEVELHEDTLMLTHVKPSFCH